jgi:hypothetical protein
MNHKDTKSTKQNGRHSWKLLLVRAFVPLCLCGFSLFLSFLCALCASAREYFFVSEITP